jgi:hypothetical protein
MAKAVRGLPGARRGYVHFRRTRLACQRSRVRRGDDQAQLEELTTWQQPGKRGQYRPVSPRQPRGPDLTLEHSDLMAQDEDLDVLSAFGAGEQRKPAERPQYGQVSESH